MKWLTGIFILFIVVNVALANTGNGGAFFNLVRALPGSDKLGHFTTFGVLALLLNLTLGASRLRVFSIPLLKGSLVVALAATIEEGSQVFLANRSASLADLLANYLGILLIGSVALFIGARRRSAMTTG